MLSFNMTFLILYLEYLFTFQMTGIPLIAWARSQCSLYIQNMKGFPRFKKFSNMAIPMFWLEYVSNYINLKIFLNAKC